MLGCSKLGLSLRGNCPDAGCGKIEGRLQGCSWACCCFPPKDRRLRGAGNRRGQITEVEMELGRFLGLLRCLGLLFGSRDCSTGSMERFMAVTVLLGLILSVVDYHLSCYCPYFLVSFDY